MPAPPHETAWGRKQEKRFPPQGQAVAGRNFAFSRPGSAEGPYAQKENCREASRSAQACLKVKKNNAAANNAQKEHKQNNSAGAEKSQQKRFSPPAQTKQQGKAETPDRKAVSGLIFPEGHHQAHMLRHAEHGPSLSEILRAVYPRCNSSMPAMSRPIPAKAQGLRRCLKKSQPPSEVPRMPKLPHIA